MRSADIRLVLWSFASFLAVAVFQTWPLALHLSTHLTGLPGGDTGVYVWNTWVFRHQLIDLRQSPFSTLTVLPLDGRTSLGLHNYTVFADVLALPLQPWLGVVAAFNVVYILNVALCGLGMFLLARRVTGRVPEAWLAGAMFACAPFLVARGASHFSLAAAAPLPFLMYFLDRAWRDTRLLDGFAAGMALAWAACSDPYYLVYGLMLGAIFVGGHFVNMTSVRPRPGSRHGRVLLDLAIAALACVIVGVHVMGAGRIQLASISISMRSLYTPVLILTLLVILRLFLTLRPTFTWKTPVLSRALIGPAVVAVITAVILLAPELYAIVVLAAEGNLSHAPVLWRSSAPGLDLLAFVLPNPNHPLMPRAITEWLAHQPGQFDENVASLSVVGLGVIAAAWHWARFRPSRLWTVITIGFASLALGPFVSVAGVRTFIPTPWTFVRYLPVIGEARMPQRFAVVVFMGFTVIVATALVALGRRFPAARTRLLVVVGVLLAAELLPAPRRLYAAHVPGIYRTIAADPRPVRVLELPFGIRDGLSSLGNFTAASQFYQTAHGKPLLGGYLSRVPENTKKYYRALPFMRALIVFSEGRTPTPRQLERARESAPLFIKHSELGYVVLDRSRTSDALRDFAIDTLGLTLVSTSTNGVMELYVPHTPDAE